MPLDMGRVPRNRLGPGVFHVLNRSINGTWIIQAEADKIFLRDLLVRFKKDFRINVYHWAIISSHLHLAAETVTMDDLSAYMGKVCRRYTMYHHQKYGGSGPLWVRRFRSILVQKEGYMERLGRYIERNGLRVQAVVNKRFEACALPGRKARNPIEPGLLARIHEASGGSLRETFIICSKLCLAIAGDPMYGPFPSAVLL